jgi:hypothetical protein
MLLENSAPTHCDILGTLNTSDSLIGTLLMCTSRTPFLQTRLQILSHIGISITPHFKGTASSSDVPTFMLSPLAAKPLHLFPHSQS